MMTVIFLLGVFVGVLIGLVVMAALRVAHEADRAWQNFTMSDVIHGRWDVTDWPPVKEAPSRFWPAPVRPIPPPPGPPPGPPADARD